MIQLTDDDLNIFAMDLHDYIIGHPLLVDPAYEDEGYDNLREFVFQRLEKYSNGYVNYN